MHTRRIATFLLGAWICGMLMVGAIELQNIGLPNAVMTAPIPGAAKLIQSLGREQVGSLLRHYAAEQNRRFSPRWEQIQLGLGLALGVSLLRATQARILPVTLSAIMLALVVFEYVALTPELTYLGREADFSTNGSAGESPATLQVVYVAVEMAKIVVGGVLAAYLFVFRNIQRTVKSNAALEDAAHS
jgi:hypothetical protein